MCVCVIANEDVCTLIQGCQLRQVSPARDGASWAVSCPGFGQVSPGQGQAAAGGSGGQLGSVRHLLIWVPRPQEDPTALGLGWDLGPGVLLRGPRPLAPSPGEQGCWWDGHWEDAPTNPPVIFSPTDLTQNLLWCEMAAGKQTLN